MAARHSFSRGAKTRLLDDLPDNLDDFLGQSDTDTSDDGNDSEDSALGLRRNSRPGSRFTPGKTKHGATTRTSSAGSRISALSRVSAALSSFKDSPAGPPSTSSPWLKKKTVTAPAASASAPFEGFQPQKLFTDTSSYLATNASAFSDSESTSSSVQSSFLRPDHQLQQRPSQLPLEASSVDPAQPALGAYPDGKREPYVRGQSGVDERPVKADVDDESFASGTLPSDISVDLNTTEDDKRKFFARLESAGVPIDYAALNAQPSPVRPDPFARAPVDALYGNISSPYVLGDSILADDDKNGFSDDDSFRPIAGSSVNGLAGGLESVSIKPKTDVGDQAPLSTIPAPAPAPAKRASDSLTSSDFDLNESIHAPDPVVSTGAQDKQQQQMNYTENDAYSMSFDSISSIGEGFGGGDEINLLRENGIEDDVGLDRLGPNRDGIDVPPSLTSNTSAAVEITQVDQLNLASGTKTVSNLIIASPDAHVETKTDKPKGPMSLIRAPTMNEEHRIPLPITNQADERRQVDENKEAPAKDITFSENDSWRLEAVTGMSLEFQSSVLGGTPSDSSAVRMKELKREETMLPPQDSGDRVLDAKEKESKTEQLGHEQSSGRDVEAGIMISGQEGPGSGKSEVNREALGEIRNEPKIDISNTSEFHLRSPSSSASPSPKSSSSVSSPATTGEASEGATKSAGAPLQTASSSNRDFKGNQYLTFDDFLAMNDVGDQDLPTKSPSKVQPEATSTTPSRIPTKSAASASRESTSVQKSGKKPLSSTPSHIPRPASASKSFRGGSAAESKVRPQKLGSKTKWSSASQLARGTGSGNQRQQQSNKESPSKSTSHSLPNLLKTTPGKAPAKKGNQETRGQEVHPGDSARDVISNLSAFIDRLKSESTTVPNPFISAPQPPQQQQQALAILSTNPLSADMDSQITTLAQSLTLKTEECEKQQAMVKELESALSGARKECEGLKKEMAILERVFEERVGGEGVGGLKGDKEVGGVLTMEDAARIRKEIEEQEQLIQGYQTENEKLVDKVKSLQKKLVESEKRAILKQTKPPQTLIEPPKDPGEKERELMGEVDRLRALLSDTTRALEEVQMKSKLEKVGREKKEEERNEKEMKQREDDISAMKAEMEDMKQRYEKSIVDIQNRLQRHKEQEMRLHRELERYKRRESEEPEIVAKHVHKILELEQTIRQLEDAAYLIKPTRLAEDQKGKQSQQPGVGSIKSRRGGEAVQTSKSKPIAKASSSSQYMTRKGDGGTKQSKAKRVRSDAGGEMMVDIDVASLKQLQNHLGRLEKEREESLRKEEMLTQKIEGLEKEIASLNEALAKANDQLKKQTQQESADPQLPRSAPKESDRVKELEHELQRVIKDYSDLFEKLRSAVTQHGHGLLSPTSSDEQPVVISSSSLSALGPHKLDLIYLITNQSTQLQSLTQTHTSTLTQLHDLKDQLARKEKMLKESARRVEELEAMLRDRVFAVQESKLTDEVLTLKREAEGLRSENRDLKARLQASEEARKALHEATLNLQRQNQEGSVTQMAHKYHEQALSLLTEQTRAAVQLQMQAQAQMQMQLQNNKQHPAGPGIVGGAVKDKDARSWNDNADVEELKRLRRLLKDAQGEIEQWKSKVAVLERLVKRLKAGGVAWDEGKENVDANAGSTFVASLRMRIKGLEDQVRDLQSQLASARADLKKRRDDLAGRPYPTSPPAGTSSTSSSSADIELLSRKVNVLQQKYLERETEIQALILRSQAQVDEAEEEAREVRRRCEVIVRKRDQEVLGYRMEVEALLEAVGELKQRI